MRVTVRRAAESQVTTEVCFWIDGLNTDITD